MKKITSLSLVLIMLLASVFTLSGCDSPPDGNDGDNTTATTITTEATNPDVSDVTTATTTETTELSSSTPHAPTGEFRDITAEELVREITFGWNLGNTLDAYHSGNPSEPMQWVDYDNMIDVETAWIGRRYVTRPELFAVLRDLGFNAVRIPVTWYEMSGGDPDYTIRPEWMAHVQGIVDMAVDQDMIVILNTHHDEFIMRFDDPDAGERAVTALWTQIAERFRDYNEKLIFAGLNEPRARTNEWNTGGRWNWNGSYDSFQTVNRWNQAFVDAVRATGGNNEKRHLMLATYAAQARSEQLNGFELPTDPITANGTSRFILSVHTYSPFEWAHNARGDYGGDSIVRNDIDRVADRAAELGVPVIFGEWGSRAANDHRQRVQHASDYIRLATQARNRANPVVMACFWWDDGENFLLIDRLGNVSDNAKEIVDAKVQARNQ
jgi:endoglucanase